MKMKLRITCLALIGALAAACGESSGGGDADADATSDGQEDGTQDGGVDPRPDDGGETAPETAEDLRMDEIIPPDAPSETVDAPADQPGCEGCAEPNACCGGRCASLQYDPDNCSGCGAACPGGRPYCDAGTCIATPCQTACIGTTTCCGADCCELDEVCCGVSGPGPIGGPNCYPDVCPPDCPWCA